MTKKFLFFLLPLSFFLLPLKIKAQSCTGNSGRAGNCTATMNCPPANIDGQGTCTDPIQICCLTNVTPPAGDGGSGDCSDTCTNTAGCLDVIAPPNGICTNGICSGPTCPTCTGNSGYFGTCTTQGFCNTKGKNSLDGVGSCTGGTVCCTNAPPAEKCTLTGVPPYLVGAFFEVKLASDTPDTFYTTTTSPVCMGPTSVTTDSAGNASFTKDCGPPEGSYTITARAGAVSCSLDVEVLNIPGPPCRGYGSGLNGYCVMGIACPGGYEGDGGYPNVCSVPDQYCCVPINNVVPSWFCDVRGLTARGVDTGLGCMTFWFGPFTAKILAWGGVINLGIAFVIILIAIIIFMTSGGDSKKIQAARELLLSAIGGILLIVISLVLLNFLGVNVLNLSNLGFRIRSVDEGPIIFKVPEPTPTPLPTPTPFISPTPTPIPPQPTDILPTPRPMSPTPCPRCCVEKRVNEDCKDKCANASNTICRNCCVVNRTTGKMGDLCSLHQCVQTVTYCAGDPIPHCI